ncbi:YfbR-like 5'-deoxynucleotidase [Bombilactobacillus bombi]|uniref:YfbR-like 5'-deoxynucleotidase n=1 Tax=Bombilactobacillus bombi TaxID=1303590 RepID=UPI0015E5ACE7|nr:YfbR-like 5'-deoxynucleotidase [Bombilactobacillus bombi]MBA1392493.1 HD domain-containing protein [Lactobacillus sp. XV13L]MBA1434418.1 HD domain-containing protein [Bombilactobacillus bombi]
MGIHQFIQGLTNLENLDRAPGHFQYQKHSVAAHSFKVAEIAQILGDIEEMAGQQVNWQSLYEKALNHDYTERFIGDIKTPVKYATKQLRQMLAQVDNDMTENFIQKEIPANLQDRFRRRLGEGKDNTLEGHILAIADKIDLLYESFGEIEKGNPDNVFIEIFSESLSTIKQFEDLACGKYFLEIVLPDLLNEDFASREQLTAISKKILAE